MDNARIAGLSRAATRTEILRAREAAALTARVGTNETDIATNVTDIATLDGRVDDLEGVAWTAVSFQNSWVNGSSQPAQYRKIGDVVHLRGHIGGGTLSTTAFTLPVGYRPPNNLYFTILGTGAAAGYFALLSTAGAFNVYGPSNANMHFNAINFSVT